MTETAHPFQTGDFVKETLVTDTVVWEVVGMTTKTVTLRRTARVPNVMRHPYVMAVDFAVEPDPTAEQVVRKVRKDGTVRLASWARPLRPSHKTTFDQGEYHYESVDYSYP
jgi:hypothetical protein